MLLRVHVIRTEALWLSGRLALAEAERSRQGAPALVAEADRMATLLDRQGVEYAKTWAHLLRAGVSFRRGHADAAIDTLRIAGREADTNRLLLCGAVAQRLCGLMLGGDEGAALVQRAEDAMKKEGIRNAARITAMFAPGFSP
jgi:hypothetical protein